MNGSTWANAPYNKTAHSVILLTTGASEKFNKQGIYDLAGNVWEWTLERYFEANNQTRCSSRGLSCNSPNIYSADYRIAVGITGSQFNFGFRVSIY